MPINPQNITWDDDNSQPSQIVWDDEGVGEEIIGKMIKAESNGNPNAVSKKGAMGTMQLMPATAKELGVTDPFDEEQNIQAGTKYVNALYRKYGDTEKALAAYNWGPGNLDKHLKKNPDNWKDRLPSETRNYIAKVNSPKQSNIAWDDESIVWDDKPSIIDQAIETVKGVGKNIVGKGEAALSTLSGLMATPVAGLAGLVTSAGGLYPEKGAQTVEDVSNLLAYRPQTERGQQDAEFINKPLELLDTGTGWLGQKVADITGMPELGAATKAGAMLGLPTLGGKLFKGLSKGKVPVETPVKSPVESSELRPVEVLDESKAVTPSIDKYEAYVKGGSTSPLPKYAEGSAINLDRLDTTMDVKQLVNQFTKENEAKIGKKVVTWEETQQAARDLAWDEKDFLKTARTKGSFNAAEIDAMRTIHTNAISDLQRTLRELPADRAQLTDATRLEVLDKVNNYIEIMKATSAKSSEAGRALNIHKRMIAEDPDFIANTNMQKAMKQIMDKRGGKKLTDDLIRDLKDVDWANPSDVKNIIKKYNKASPGDMVYEAWLNAILSGPSTHATNILSNSLTLGLKVPEHTVASVLRRELPFGEMKAETVGMIQGLREGVRAGLRAFRTGEASEMWNKVETARTPSIPGKLGEAVRMPTKALTGADEFFKAIVYRSEFNRLAFLEAKKTGAKGKALAGKMAEILENPTAEMLDKAHNEALYRTFNKPLGNIGSWFMRGRNMIPGAKYIAPFVRTPANIAKYALERTPLAAGKIALDLKRGNLTKAELYDDMSRSAIGTAIGVVVYQMAKEGTITGGGPKNSAERETKYRTGWQPYSIKIGDKYYSYNRLEPLGSVLGLSADLADVTKMDDEEKMSDKFGRIAASFGKNITSKTFVQGVSNLLDATSDPDRYGEKLIKQLAGSPVPSVVAGTVRATDPTVYETNNPVDTVKARMGMTSDMFPKRDIWGRPIERAGTMTSRMVSPVIASKAKDDPIDLEMDRLNLAVSAPSKKIRGVELEPKEYDAYAKRAGELSRERVERYMRGGAYSHLRDELKKIAVKNIIERSRVQAGIEMWKDMERGRRFKPIDKKYGTSLSHQGLGQ
jgi:hypothetical protein